MGKQARVYNYNSRTTLEVPLIEESNNNEVTEWVNKIKGGLKPGEKESTLKDLLLSVRDEKTTLDVACRAVHQAHVFLELKDISEQTRWLKMQRISFVDSLVSKMPTIQR